MYSGSDRPRIKINMGSIDRIIELVAFTFIVIHIILIAVYYSHLPASIPTHFNVEGNPDGYGKKSTLLLIPGFSVLIYLLLTIAAFFPHIYNYPVRITEHNAEVQYRLAIRMIRVIKAIVIVMFAFINYSVTYLHINFSTIFLFIIIAHVNWPMISFKT